MANPQHSLWQGDPAILNASRNAPPLKPGATGSGVARLRDALKAVGAPDIDEPPDRFGPRTAARMSAFQGLYGLTPDGVAGAQSIGRLDALLLGTSPQRPWKEPEVNGNREQFLQKVAAACGPAVRQNGLPVSAMLACAAVESGWGTGTIYKETGNLFSMQKWPWVKYPTTARTLWRDTVIQTEPVRKTAKAPFNTAIDLADAGRQWCEWIASYGDADGPPGNIDPKAKPAAHAGAIGRRKQLLGMAGDPLQFARNLYLVSFGESAAKGRIYAQVLSDNRLTRFD